MTNIFMHDTPLGPISIRRIYNEADEPTSNWAIALVNAASSPRSNEINVWHSAERALRAVNDYRTGIPSWDQIQPRYQCPDSLGDWVAMQVALTKSIRQH